MKNRILEVVDFQSDTRNFKLPFEKMTRMYGKEFIDLLQGMWESNCEVLSEEAFCELNGVPMKFFNSKIRKISTTDFINGIKEVEPIHINGYVCLF